jgi:hypothetical protein
MHITFTVVIVTTTIIIRIRYCGRCGQRWQVGIGVVAFQRLLLFPSVSIVFIIAMISSSGSRTEEATERRSDAGRLEPWINRWCDAIGVEARLLPGERTNDSSKRATGLAVWGLREMDDGSPGAGANVGELGRECGS